MDVKTNLKILSTTKVNKHIPSGFSMSTISPFRSKENKVKIVGKDFVNP